MSQVAYLARSYVNHVIGGNSTDIIEQKHDSRTVPFYLNRSWYSLSAPIGLNR